MLPITSKSLIKQLFVIITPFIFSFPVLAASWENIYQDTRQTIYIEKNSISNHFPKITTWIKLSYMEPRVNSFYTTYTEAKEYTTINCSLRTLQILDQILYNGDGSVAWSSTHPSAVSKIVPDTIGEIEYNYLCTKYKPKIKKTYTKK